MMKAVRLSLAIASVVLTRHQASATEATQGDKMMLAASVVLSGATGIVNGHINVTKDDYAEFQPGWSTTNKIYFKKAANCIYIEVVESKNIDEQRYHMIDFSKLNGRWLQNGSSLSFLSSSTPHCFREGSRQSCSPGRALIPVANNQAQLIDDVSYLLRHGCGDAVSEDPY